MISVYQIYFDEKTKQHLDKDFIPWLNTKKDDYFENMVIAEVYKKFLPPQPEPESNPSYLGISSWKQEEKTHLTGKEIMDVIQKDIDAGTEKDIYLYSPIQIEPIWDINKVPAEMCGIIRQPNIWDQHKNRFEQIHNDNKKLNDSAILPFDLFDGKWQYSFCNYWIAKKHIFDEYCEKVLLPAIAFYERSGIKETMPKWYQHSHEGRKCNSCCFTMEGLFGAFLAHSNYSFKYICKKKLRRKYHMVRVDGFEQTSF